MKLNKADLLKLGQLRRTILPEEASGPELVDYLNGKKKAPVVVRQPLSTAKAIMFQWVLDNFTIIKAQHRGFPDCTGCPNAHFSLCFLENIESLRRGGYLTTEDPWLLKT